MLQLECDGEIIEVCLPKEDVERAGKGEIVVIKIPVL